MLKTNKYPNKQRLLPPLILLLSIITAPLTGSAVAQTTSPTILNEPLILTTDYTFETDLYFTNTHGIIIAADNISINGAGYHILGNKTIERCSWITRDNPAENTATHGILNNGYDNITIKNLEIENFATGIYLCGTNPNKIHNNTIQNCNIHNNGLSNMSGTASESITHGIHGIFCRTLHIAENEIYNNHGTGGDCDAGGNGIYIRGGGSDSDYDYNLIENNSLYHNDKAGFWTNYRMDRSTICSNHIYENGAGEGITDPQQGGLILRCVKSSDNLIKNNHITNNYGDGIFIGGNNNTITTNLVTNNQNNGLHLGRSDGTAENKLTKNTFCSNQNYDVYNVHANQQAGNYGSQNTGDSSYNYQDDDAATPYNFAYVCTPADQEPETYLSITPPQKTNNTTIHFEWYGTDDTTAQNKLNYSYQLTGYEDTWNSWTTATTKTYVNLTEKQYTFKVKTKDSTENIDPTPASYTFKITKNTAQDNNRPKVLIHNTTQHTITSTTIQLRWNGTDDTTPTSQLQYSWRLEGYSNTWNSWNSHTSTEYTNLEEGAYTFHITCRDKAGNVQDPPTTYQFTIKKPEEGNLYQINWNIHTHTQTQQLSLEKNTVTHYNYSIPQSYPTQITIQLQWEDDFTFPLFKRLHFGEDTLHFTIQNQHKELLTTATSTGTGNYTYHLQTTNNPAPQQLISLTKTDAEKTATTLVPNPILKTNTYRLQFNLTIGEKGYFRKQKDTGNIINLTITYHYLTPTLILLEDRTPPTTTLQKTKLDKDTGTATFHWQGADDIDGDDVTFHYKLEGYNTTWKQTTQKTMTYPSLSNGDYIFTIYAQDTSGNLEEKHHKDTLCVQTQQDQKTSNETNEETTNTTPDASSTLANKNQLNTPGFYSTQLLFALSITLIFIINKKRKKE